MSECEDCIDKLERKVTALTAELEQAKAYAAKADEALLDCATAYAAERAAREKAEAALTEIHKLTGRGDGHGSAQATAACIIDRILSNRIELSEAERERNEHAKHRANLDRKNQELSRENERLVDYASGCQRERDTALEERDQHIANLTREWSAHAMTRQELKASRAAREKAMSERDAAQQELERRTAWSNEQIQKLGKQLADAEDKLAGCSESVEICHRQHEQCMKLLGRIQALLLDPNAQRTEWKIRNVQDLLREMLSKGELPEGWDE